MSGKALTYEDLVKSGATLPKELQKASLHKVEIETYAMKIVGLLADAPNNNVRRKAVDRARRMLVTR